MADPAELADRGRLVKSFLLGEGFSFVPGPEDGIAKVAALRLGLDFAHRSRQQVLAFRSMLSLGLDILGATHHGESDVPDGQFVAWLGQLQWARRLPWLGAQALLQPGAEVAVSDGELSAYLGRHCDLFPDSDPKSGAAARARERLGRPRTEIRGAAALERLLERAEVREDLADCVPSSQSARGCVRRAEDVPSRCRMEFRRATNADAGPIARVHVLAWQEAYRGLLPDPFLADLSVSVERRTEFWATQLAETSPASELFVVTNDQGEVVGFASAGPVAHEAGEYDGELYAIYLLVSHQGKGLGQTLFHAAANSLRKRGFNSMMLWVLKDNPARGFYDHLGGRVFREQPIEIGSGSYVEVAYGWPGLNWALAPMPGSLLGSLGPST